jgi:hypothetical protein
VPKLLASASAPQDSRVWREPVSSIGRGVEAASAVREGWCDVSLDSRLSSARQIAA